MPFRTTRETKLQTFQYKLVHRLIVCQKKLFDMKLADNPNCLYCNETDDLPHFFLHCNKSNQFWNSFFNWWNGLGDIEIVPGFDCLAECVLFGFRTEGDIFSVLNYSILHAKYYIYCQRIHEKNTIDFFQYLIQLKQKLKIEQTICSKINSNSFEKFKLIYELL